jgi:hypothetical protein
MTPQGPRSVVAFGPEEDRIAFRRELRRLALNLIVWPILLVLAFALLAGLVVMLPALLGQFPL